MNVQSNTLRCTLLVAVLAAIAGTAQPPPGLKRTPVDIPPDNFDFPATDLFAALQRSDVVRMRRHAWNVFAAITIEDVAFRPAFMTWYTKANLFPDFTGASESNGALGVESPRQFAMSAGQAKDAGTPTSRRVLAKVYYNTVFAKYVCGGSKNPYPLLNQDTAGKDTLNDFFNTVNAQTEDRQIPAFPQGAVAVKTAWWLVKAKGPPTALPVWDPNSNSTQPGGNSPLGVAEQEPGRWARWVAVNPDLSASGESETVTKVGRVAYATRVVPIRRFFYVQLTKNQAAQVTKVLEGETITATPGAKAEAGDFLILVGLHFTTKEIPNWVWATFWWHDRPDEGPYAEQRPSMVLRRWRNYLMNVSYSMNDPREPQGSPHICFNPYLEAITPTFLASTVSNCMTCHRQAVWKGGPDFSRASGEISVADKSFAGKLRLDFIWSLSVHNDSACAAVP